ncbi:MAG TPA: tRNA (adenosine(37)-N6)-threonylcarbamoyltransferase complex ATPase subunit type 1 TsaE [Myxococcota bacterium]|nr:tRNA (adenosine(37)-N6)-threonylcarbamoyltransferase complex ATPase subunit type 1 TsaE [Myxococcota bacterium]HQK49629.1 tRNA (adenosine(37)-N6)-threonylcarbamoyltransferase complex ATPase subunit type 1 TsaE [Myxococcota bacterium]
METETAGAELATRLRPGDLVGIEGDLGSGKTVFARGVVQGLGGDPGQVHSPTFTLVNVYQTPSGPVHHIDLYRLRGVSDLEGIGFWELARGDGITLVEWIDRIPEAFEEETWHVVLALVPGQDDHRRVEWSSRLP